MGTNISTTCLRIVFSSSKNLLLQGLKHSLPQKVELKSKGRNFEKVYWKVEPLFEDLIDKELPSSTFDRFAQLVERRTTVLEVEGSSPRPDQHSGSLEN